MIAAARAAEAHDFILQLRDHNGNKGYEAFLGERGVKLQRRPASAHRTCPRLPERRADPGAGRGDFGAGSARSRPSIQTALNRVMQGKTVLAIAHRLSTIAAMDRIIVLDEGRIVEQGSHAELLAEGGLYARYWNRQSGGFIGTENQEAAE